MIVPATYQCGHDGARNFDGRNSSRRGEARTWTTKAQTRVCPRCRKAAAVQQLETMTAEQLREFIAKRISYRMIIDELVDEAGNAYPQESSKES